MAYSTGSPANARAVTSNVEPGSPSSTKSPFLVPTSNSVMSRSSSRDGRQDVDTVVRSDLRVLPAELAVDKDVDVPPQRSALVEDPARQRGIRPLQGAQRRPDRRPFDRVLRAVAREPFEGLPEADARHAGILGEQARDLARGTLRPARLDGAIAKRAPDLLGHGGGDLLRSVGLVAHPPAGAVAGEAVGDVVVLLEVPAQGEEQERTAGGRELHRGREAAVGDAEVAGGELPVEAVDVALHLEPVGLR